MDLLIAPEQGAKTSYQAVQFLGSISILEQSPDITKIELLVAAPHPTRRIIHIADCHAISRKRLDQICGTSLPDREIHDMHQALADRVEIFQKSQRRLLRWLVDFHGVREVFHEGVSEENLSEARRRVEWFRKVAPGRPRWRRELTEVSAQLRELEAKGGDSMELRQEQRKLEGFRDYELNFGALGDLLVDRPFVEVQAAEDAKAHADVMSIEPGHGIKSPYGVARDAAIVRQLLSRGPCAVIVLGSAHDLSTEVRKQGRGQCEYLRVTTKDRLPPFEQIYELHANAVP